MRAFYGEQLALSEALDARRTVRSLAPKGDERALLSASDPLNLVDVLTLGLSVPETASGRVLYVDRAPQPLQMDERSLA